MLKQSGVAWEQIATRAGEPEEAPLPRVMFQHPGNGRFHPASKANIFGLLEFFGETCTYGVRSVELRQRPLSPRQPTLRFGTLLVPGRIVLYDQLLSPWHLPWSVSANEIRRLRAAGAVVEVLSDVGHVIVSWPGNTLSDFMLYDVLMHEIGHHILQHHKGKRRKRIARTRDHEAFADRFASRCRLLHQRREGRQP